VRFGHNPRVSIAWGVTVNNPFRRLGRLLTEPMRPSAMLAVALVGVLGVMLWVNRAHLPILSGAVAAGEPTAYPTQSHPAGVFATSSARAGEAGAFAGTPAEAFPAGEAGITMPAAAAVAGFSADEVGAALTQVRAALVAGRLDRRMLVDHDPAVLLDGLAESSRKQVQPWFADGRAVSVATWLVPGEALADEPPRVSGRTTYQSGDDQGVRYLEVVTNYVWVYAFADRAVSPAVVHDEVHWRVVPKQVVRPDRGLWIASTSSYGSNMDCAQYRKGLLGPARELTSTRGGGSAEDPNQFYDPDHAMAIENTCG
jgi:hypothetical protein